MAKKVSKNISTNESKKENKIVRKNVGKKGNKIVNKSISKKEETNEKKEGLVIVLLVAIIILLAIILGIVIIKKSNTVGKSDDSNYKVNIDDNDIDISDEFNDVQIDATDDSYIGRDNAIKIALKDLKLTTNDVYDLECELDKKFDQIVYEVAFNYKNLEYEYYINPETGRIIHSFKELD